MRRLLFLSLLLLLAGPLLILHSQWMQEGNKFSGTGAIGTAGQGSSVAISADSTTVIVGAPADSGGFGAAWVFLRGTTSWGQQGKKLVASDAVGYPRLGTSVAVSADGNTAIIGGVNDNSNRGAAWIFTRSGGVWTQEGGKLLGNDIAGTAIYTGVSVGLSSDGNTAIVGGYGDNSNVGAAWIFTRSGGAWTQQGGKLVGSGAVGAAHQGRSVALSSDGNSAIIGGETDNASIGAAWVFTRTAGVWTQQGSKLVGSGYVGTYIQQGWSVALSGDGNTALVGAPNDSTTRIGAAWVFVRSAGVWNQQGGKLFGTGYAGSYVYQGYSVSLSGDGNTAVIGGYGDSPGAVWVFTRSAGIWSPQGSKIVGGGISGSASFGIAVSVSGDGNTVAIGGPGDASNGPGSGALWIYTRGGGIWTWRHKLTGSGAAGEAMQGQSLSLSADGRYAVVAGPKERGGGVALWSFEHATGGWIQRGAKATLGTYNVGTMGTQWTALSGDGRTRVTGVPWFDTSAGRVYIDTIRTTFPDWRNVTAPVPANGISSGDRYGFSVAVSHDGTTAIFGAPGLGGYGAVLSANKIDGVWDRDAVTFGRSTFSHGLGSSVGISGDGMTAIVGAPEDGGGGPGGTPLGATWVFNRSGDTWPATGTKLVGTGEVGTDVQQGYSVAISRDGNTAIVGGPRDDGGKGAAWAFVRSGGTWTQLGNKLVGSGATGDAAQGTCVAISADGGTVAVGGPRDNGSRGAVWLFVRYNGAFVQLGTKLTGAGMSGSAQLGTSVALNDWGSLCIAGGPMDNGSAGAVWSFRLSREATIASISDIPTDQGGKVRITWQRSEFDRPRDIHQILQYGVWRRIPAAGTQLTPPAGSVAATLNDSLGQLFDLVGTVPAVQSPTYNFVAPTLFDSSGSGPHLTRFIVTAHTADPNLFTLSTEDSGASVDNLSPAGVTGGSITPLPDGAILLAWNTDRIDGDLKGYQIHRSTSAGFAPGSSTALAFTADTSFSDTTAPHGLASYYRITAVDLHDNAGPPSAELHATPVGIAEPGKEIPKEFSLSQNFPNPFNPSTTIRYGLPRSADVVLTVYNALGQQIAVLAQGVEEAGVHEVRFDAAGLATGVYLVRLKAGDFVQTRKLLLVQ